MEHRNVLLTRVALTRTQTSTTVSALTVRGGTVNIFMTKQCTEVCIK